MTPTNHRYGCTSMLSFVTSVRSQRAIDRSYTVTHDAVNHRDRRHPCGWCCTCPDHRYHGASGHLCKHIDEVRNREKDRPCLWTGDAVGDPALCPGCESPVFLISMLKPARDLPELVFAHDDVVLYPFWASNTPDTIRHRFFTAGNPHCPDFVLTGRATQIEAVATRFRQLPLVADVSRSADSQILAVHLTSPLQ